MSEPVFFLQSKRFWSLPAAYLVTEGAGRLADAGLELAPEDVTAVTNVATAVMIWLVAMFMGKRGLKIKPK